MNVFDLRTRLVADYQSYTRSFIKIRDPRISAFVDDALSAGAFWPEPRDFKRFPGLKLFNPLAD